MVPENFVWASMTIETPFCNRFGPFWTVDSVKPLLKAYDVALILGFIDIN